MNTPIRSILILLALLVLGVGGGYLYRQWPGHAWNVTPSTPMRVDAECDPGRNVCLALAEGIALRFGLGPGLRPLRLFPIRVEVDGPGVAGVLVNLSMRDMDMGINRFRLTRTGAGSWAGEGMIPVCWVGRRDWIASVTLETDAGPYQADFPFEIATAVAGPSG